MTTLSISDLENVLRGVSNLSGACVTAPYPNVSPWLANISGAINIHGTTYFWETEIDLRELKSREDVGALIEHLLLHFDGAAR